MIRQLTIKNVAVIDSADIEFDEGFNILTGETGAGKSIIIDSLNMIKGERASKAIIRSGETKARVSALVNVNDEQRAVIEEETGIECPDGEMMILREITADGKNNIRINGTAVTLAILKKVGDTIITIHGQHDNTSLLSKKTHIVFLDRFGGENISALSRDYREVYSEYRETAARLESLTKDEQEKARRADMLKFQIDEISSADLHVGEDEELEERKNVLENTQTIAEAVNSAYSIIYDSGDYGESAYDMLWNGIKELETAADIDSSLSEIHTALSDAGYAIEENLRSLKRYIDNISCDREELDEIEERLDLLFSLKRKYGGTIEKILEYYDEICIEADEIENSDELAQELEKKLSELEKKRSDAAGRLTKERVRLGGLLSEQVMKELSELDMAKVRFSVRIDECSYKEDGADDVEFLICTNVGDDFKPLAKIASGGELSRIMLAIKSVLSDCESADSLVFDEVDTGVSGHAAQSLGVKLYEMSKSSQVLCITHLPQIAAMAGSHYLIQKHVTDGRTATDVRKLDRNQRVDEIARTLGGAVITDITRENAKELLNQADEYKNA